MVAGTCFALVDTLPASAGDAIVTHFENQRQQDPKTDTSESALHKEAHDLLTRPALNYHSSTARVNYEGEHLVAKNESLTSIARKSLLARGQSVDDLRAVVLEVKRILEANREKYPSLVDSPNMIKEGWSLRISRAAESKSEVQPRKTGWQPLKLDKEGNHLVKAGESLSSIASRELMRRGQDACSPEGLAVEMQRIVDNNKSSYPSLESNREHIRLGWKLKIWDDTLGPEPSVEWKPWTTAEPGKMTVVRKGERAVAENDAWVIVEPGAKAILNSGAKGFLADRGVIEKAMPGSLVVADGGVINDYGATIQATSDRVMINTQP